ncbi:MAG: hypothetical protein IKL48_05400 [Elusimicrobiaceae bacterium]|nr:hypothetical protein [Elusimicrobiaceae bacterium]
MKRVILFLAFLISLSLSAHSLPEHVYFQAMNDELMRTQKQLRVKGSASPFFIAYKLKEEHKHQVSASLGSALPENAPTNHLSALVYMYTGKAAKNSSGFVPMFQFSNSGREFAVEFAKYVPKSYEAIRRKLWELTDKAYIFASSAYDKKEVYKKRKGLQDELPDFSKAPVSAYRQEIPDFEPLPADTQAVINQISAQGKKIPYLERFVVRRERVQNRYYFIDSEKDFAQYFVPQDYVHVQALFRGKEGDFHNIFRSYNLSDDPQQQIKQMQEAASEILAEVEAQHQAVRAKQPYVGPVLFEKKAAVDFFFFFFYPSARHSKSLLRADDRTDNEAGYFKDRLGMRVMSAFFDVYDKPLLSYKDGIYLSGFMPVDDEGVAAENIQLVKDGKLIALPTMRSPMKGQEKNNGHARANYHMFPRAGLTNLLFEAKESLSQEQMQERLLQRCRELELEYCYIIPSSFEYWRGKGLPELVQRIYTKDGRKEAVNGLEIEGLSARSLRSILAAGKESYVFGDFSKYEMDGASPISITAPSILVDEIELVPDMKVPDTPPSVDLP